MTTRRAILAMFVCLLGPVAISFAADQPQWGRPGGRNQTSDEKNLPDSFDLKSGKNIRWTAALGSETYATPVIAGGRIYIGTNNARPRDPRHKGDRGVLLCLSEKDGALLWQLVVPKITTSPYWDWPGGGVCSPVTVDGEELYAVSSRDEVMRLNPLGMAKGNEGPYRDEARHCVPAGSPPVELTPADADILWLLDLIKECGVRQHDAAHCSILVRGPYLYVNTSNGVGDTHRTIDAPDAPSLVVIDKRTGKLVARDNERIGPRIFHCTWSSPSMGTVGGRDLIFFGGGDGVIYAFEPYAPPAGGAADKVATLKKVWQFDCDPAGPKENVHRWTANRKEGPSNIKSMPVFHDGRLYVTAGGDLWWGKNEAHLLCIDPSGSGDITKSGLLWSYALQKHCLATPAVQDGLVFVGDTGKTIHCVDAATGKPCWTHQAKGEIWASPLVADGKVYVATRKGEVLIFAAAREKKLLFETELDAPIASTPVAANGTIYIATNKTLYAFARLGHFSEP